MILLDLNNPAGNFIVLLISLYLAVFVIGESGPSVMKSSKGLEGGALFKV